MDTFESVFIRNLALQNVTLPGGCVFDSTIAVGAKVDAAKLRMRIRADKSQRNGSANVAQREGLAVVYGSTGTMLAVYARNITAATAGSSTTVKIKKNGVDILTAPIVLDNPAGTAVQNSVSFSDATLVAGDLLEVDITITGGAPGQGVQVMIVRDEDPQ